MASPTGDAFVFHYDGAGALIQSEMPPALEGEEHGAQARFSAGDPHISTASLAEVLPAVRLVSARYQDDPALTALGLT